MKKLSNLPFLNFLSYLNFASLGSFFGHELSHSVTPRYTEFERLMAPWSDHFLKEYLSRAQCFVSQYTNYYDKSAEQHVSIIVIVKKLINNNLKNISQIIFSLMGCALLKKTCLI